MKKFILAAVFISLAAVIIVPTSAGAQVVPPPSAFGGDYDGESGGSCSNLTNEGLRGIVGCLIDIFGMIMIVLIAAAVVYVMYGAFLMISSEEKRDAGKQTIMYGVIGLFVMVSVWGFVNILNSTFNLRGQPIDPPRLLKQ